MILRNVLAIVPALIGA